MASTGTWSRVLYDAEEETARLMISLQLEDVQSLTSLSSTKHAPDDFKFALTTYEEDLRQYHAILIFEAEETTLAEVFAVAASDSSEESPLTQAFSTPITPTANILTFACVVCEERFDVDHCWQAPCTHYYCDEHLGDLFTISLKDRTLYPPRCCRQIMPFEDVRLFLSEELVGEFEAKKQELDDTKPTYCYVQDCFVYINENHKIENIATCPVCGATTCIICKQASHEGDCKDDDTMQETLALAEREGWRRCPTCDRLVELRSGCNHMTCLCRTEFCYVCGAYWKNCDCSQFDEARLLERGQEIIEREGRGNIRQMVEHLRHNHECVNHRWVYTRGGLRCEGCGDFLPTFIFRCAHCRSQMCRRCRDNRL